MMFKCMFILLALASASRVHGQNRPTPFNRCQGREALPLAVHFPTCNVNGHFCELSAGRPIVIRVGFAPTVARVRALGAALHVWNGRSWENWDLGFRNNACDFLTNEQLCPIEVGHRRTYELRTTIPWTVTLNTQQTLHVRLQDQNGNSIACVEITTIFTNN